MWCEWTTGVEESNGPGQLFSKIWWASQSYWKDRLASPCSRNLNSVCLGFGPEPVFWKDPQIILAILDLPSSVQVLSLNILK